MTSVTAIPAVIRATDLITATRECDIPATAPASNIVVIKARIRVPRSVVAGQESRLRAWDTAAHDRPDRADIGVDSAAYRAIAEPSARPPFVG